MVFKTIAYQNYKLYKIFGWGTRYDLIYKNYFGLNQNT